MACRAYDLRLVGGFALSLGSEALTIPSSAQRLLGFLALQDRPLPRAYVAETLWPDVDEVNAQASLRTALWRLNPRHRRILDVTPGEVSLHPGVRVDARVLHRASREYRRTGVLPPPEALLDIRGELLPGCWDCWLVFERERIRHEAVELLEGAGNACLARGDVHNATLLALAAVECDPLRESANLLVVHARLAASDPAGAVRYALTYTETLKEELQLPAPERLRDLLPAYFGGPRPSSLPRHVSTLLARPAATPR